MDGLNGRMERTEERICELGNRLENQQRKY